MDDFWSAFIRYLDHDFDLVAREVVAHELLFETGSVVVFLGSAGRVADGMKDVVTGQAVLERGSANSDVLGEYHASMCANRGV
jgi:hypothetical protein